MKNFIISSSGLKNVVFTTKHSEDSFCFVFGKKEIEMNRFYADFISPKVSHIHQIDPTFDHLDLTDSIQKLKISNEIMSKDLFENFQRIASGYSIDLSEEMSYKIRILSILIDNDEIFNQMNKYFPISTEEETNLDSCLEYLKYFEILKRNQNQGLLDFVSSHFYLFDVSKLQNLSKSVIYSIISNDHLRVSNEDSLYDLITQLFSNENDENEDQSNYYENKILFYEQIIIEKLSESKFQDLVDSIDLNQMTQFLWNKLKNCFYYQFLKNKKSDKKVTNYDRYNDSDRIKTIEYDNNINHRFNGIIYYLGNGNPKSVVDNHTIEVTSSSVLSDNPNHDAKNVVNFSQDELSFLSNDKPDSWLLYDFKDRKVKPTHYSIKSHGFGEGKGCYHPQTWRIEGSNDLNDWKILDSRNKDKSLDNKSVSNTFEIQNHLDKNDYFRYIRIRQTGVNTFHDNNFGFAALEYFGSILE